MPILSKPYVITDASRQSEDIDRMFDDVYIEMAELEREHIEIVGHEGGGVQSTLGREYEEADTRDWPTPVTDTDIARLSFPNYFTRSNEFAEVIFADKGLQFPATQVADTGANVLDDYEEGTWTPVLGGEGGTSGQTYSIQVGRYIKIGKVVAVNFVIVLSAKGTITSNSQIQGLPFTVENTTNSNYAGSVGFWGSTVSTLVFLAYNTIANTTTAYIYGAAAAATDLLNLGQASWNDTTNLQGCILYRATA